MGHQHVEDSERVREPVLLADGLLGRGRGRGCGRGLRARVNVSARAKVRPTGRGKADGLAAVGLAAGPGRVAVHARLGSPSRPQRWQTRACPAADRTLPVLPRASLPKERPKRVSGGGWSAVHWVRACVRSRKPPSWAKAAMVLLCAKTATSTATAGKRPTIASATVPDVASISGSSHSIDDDAFAMIPAYLRRSVCELRLATSCRAIQRR